ncbi:MAG: DUF1553 domain-containing protein [Pirellulales bacterium]|nr:DUF1553 domain-containing protein [Pirellulales bacterium]
MADVASSARLLICVCGLLLGPATALAGEPTLPPAARRAVDYTRDVQPIFASACYSCHDANSQQSDYRLDQKRSALDGGAIGGAIVPGKSEASLLLRYVAGLEEGLLMPAKGKPLSAEQIGILRAWIDQGAAWPDSADEASTTSQHWAYQPLVQAPIPTVRRKDWSRTPLDVFILQSLEEHGFTPSPEADKRTLIRRVTFNLTGLPPTPAEVDAFLADDSPEAYDRVVDRLLASPRYGERWARHWIDVVHFAETHGHDQDRPRPHAWPYRDYLIQAFNHDTPYARFVQEQLAGDVLFPEDACSVVALGFIAAGPWDESSQMCIVDDTQDKREAQNLDRDDMVTTTMSTFCSSTVHCARCHNHKFDPIAQADYYSLQAVFAGVDRVDRPYDVDPAVASTRRAILDEQRMLEAGKVSRERLLSPDVQNDVAAWESNRGAHDGPWTVLEPVSFLAGKSQAKKLPDHSLLYLGNAPDTDTYTIVAHTDLRHITAVQVEVLTDDSLPQKGPGRQKNGNLHLSELRIEACAKKNPSESCQLKLQNASADFDQEGWSAALAVDGVKETAWGIHPAVGQSHRAAFELSEPLDYDGTTILSFVLDQQHGSEHLIGRVRLSVTSTPLPVRVSSLPESIAAILEIPSHRRTDDERAELALHVLKWRIEERLAALPPMQKVYAAASEFAPQGNVKPAKIPRPIHVLRRGNLDHPLEAALPGALSCLPELPSRFALDDLDDEGSRRAALARWITDRANVLTWRSAVNRTWHYHFGRGLVDTPNDFGHLGATPSHPELLDWLALWFRDSGGSLKQLHRLIVTSATYRQSSQFRAEMAAVDADNRLLWRMNRQRLDAESVRDATLQITGKLDLAMGGPSVQQFVQSPGIHVTPIVDYDAFDVDSPASCRRSIYRFLFRTLPDPFMESMDCPDASQLAPTRSSSVTALQALAMLNNRFMVRQCEHFADRVASSSNDICQQVAAAFELALGRPPTKEETDLLARHATQHGLANVCRLLLNSNEFMFVN